MLDQHFQWMLMPEAELPSAITDSGITFTMDLNVMPITEYLRETKETLYK